MTPRLIVVGNSNCRRVEFWKAAAARLGWPPVTLLAYRDLLVSRYRLESVQGCDWLVRFETPAGDWETFQGLLKHGIHPSSKERLEVLDESAIAALEYDRGWIIHPRQAYLGWRRLLQDVAKQLSGPRTGWLHPVEDIAEMFDKVRCQQRLAGEAVPIPASFGACRNYLEIRDRCRNGNSRVMIKLAHGSGAAGAIAVHWSNKRIRALTTVAEIFVDGRSRMYCSKQVRYLRDEHEIALLIDRLCREKVQVERWLPKACCDGRNFDLRVVVIGGAARHVVMRSNTSVFTNLTLGASRGDVDWVQSRMGREAWQSMMASCTRAASAYPESYTLGLDVLVRPDFRRHALLEINAFGDLLPGCMSRGEDTYLATLSSWQTDHRRELAS
jgi:hypothetical protein